MDFFTYFNVSNNFTRNLYIGLSIGLICFALVFIFQGIALYTIANKAGYKNKWMAFVPVLSTYYIGVCAQKNRIFNVDAKKIAIVVAVMEGILIALSILDCVVTMVIVAPYEVVEHVETALGGYNEYWLIGVPESLEWAQWIYLYLNNYIISILQLIFLILQLSLFMAFFQTYACNRYLIFAITSVLFPVFGILSFIVKNNTGMNYGEYMRRRQAAQYRQYQEYQQYQQYRQQQQNPYNRNYNNNYNNPYSGQSSSQTKADDPFDNLGSPSGSDSNDSPFDEFN